MPDLVVSELDILKTRVSNESKEEGIRLVLDLRNVVNDLEKSVALLSKSSDILKRLHVYKLADSVNSSLNEILIGLSNLSPVYRDWKFLEELTQLQKGNADERDQSSI